MRRAFGLAVGAALALLVVTGISVLPIWTRPHAGWLPDDMPAACLLVAALRARGAQRGGSPGFAESSAQAAAQAALDARTEGLTVSARGIPVRAVFDGTTRTVWGFTGVAQPLSDDPVAAVRLAAVVWIDAVTRIATAVDFGMDDAQARCAFNIRSAIRRTVFSPLVLVFAAYSGLLSVGFAAALIRRRRGPTELTKEG